MGVSLLALLYTESPTSAFPCCGCLLLICDRSFAWYIARLLPIFTAVQAQFLVLVFVPCRGRLSLLTNEVCHFHDEVLSQPQFNYPT